MANNSTAYTEKPGSRKLISEFMKLIESKSGERGIFNREAATNACLRRAPHLDFGINPCGEIILRPDEFCNLTEVVARAEDTPTELVAKVKAATILGCVQSTLTDFKFLGADWKKNCEEERLLGVSITGLRDHTLLKRISYGSTELLRMLKGVTIETATEWAEILGINVPAAITCVKPSGTVSQLVNCSSGLHARHSKYYRRTVVVSSVDPISTFMVDSGVSYIPVMDDHGNEISRAFSFPIAAPEGSVVGSDVSAMDQLEYWLMLKKHWCEHNPSCTITVKDSEWTQVLAWVDNRWDNICGLTFMPHDGNTYQNMPYEEIDEETYNRLTGEFPNIDFSQLSKYEHNDYTSGSREFACQGGACEL